MRRNCSANKIAVVRGSINAKIYTVRGAQHEIKSQNPDVEQGKREMIAIVRARGNGERCLALSEHTDAKLERK